MEFVVIVWLMLSAGVGYMASERGRSGFGWAAISIVTSPLLGFIIVLLTRDLVVEAANRERDELRHSENLAALARRDIGTKPDFMRDNDPHRSTLVLAQKDRSENPILVADELTKLASLVDAGHLTSEEFTQQKSRLLGISLNREISSMAEQSDAHKLITDLSTSQGCVALLIAHGCRVNQPAESVWEILQPSGITEYIRSSESLQAFAIEFSNKPSTLKAK
jgi:hypothetical protein